MLSGLQSVFHEIGVLCLLHYVPGTHIAEEMGVFPKTLGGWLVRNPSANRACERAKATTVSVGSEGSRRVAVPRYDY